MLKDRVKLYQDREVFRFKKENEYHSISWNELNSKVDIISRALLKLGFGLDSKLGIFSANKPEWSITDYAILGIRGVVVPFFGTATREQLKYIVDETKMKLIFVGDKEQFEKAYWLFEHSDSLKTIIYYDKNISTSDKSCIYWDDLLSLGKDDEQTEKLEAVHEEVLADDLATIIYTSGTTGEPKGVMLTHDNFMHCFRIHDKRLDPTNKDISMCFLPLSHVFERSWSYYMLYKGVVNVFLENPREVINELPKVNPTLMCTVPRFYEKTKEGIELEYEKWSGVKQKIFDWSIAIGHKHSEYVSRNTTVPFFLNLKRSIANKLVLKKLREIFGSNMRVMPCSGAAIRPELLKFFHATGLFVNYGYGTTETTATVSCFKTDVYNFDNCGTIMPEIEIKLGEENEILVKGKTVFSGYYNKPEETAKVLQDGWYKTGDEGTIAENGDLIMKDRLRDLFKTSLGKYVSPQKIELMLGQDPLIEQIITVGDNKKYITALIVPTIPSLKVHAREMGLDFTSDKELVSSPEIYDFIEKRLHHLQKELAPYEQIRKFALLDEPFTIENDGMTSTLKLKRKSINNQYRELIENLY